MRWIVAIGVAAMLAIAPAMPAKASFCICVGYIYDNHGNIIGCSMWSCD